MKIDKSASIRKKLEKLSKHALIDVNDTILVYTDNKAEFVLSFNISHVLRNNRYRFEIYFTLYGSDDYFLTKSYVFEGSYKEFYTYYLTFLKEYNKIKDDTSIKDRRYFYNLGFSNF